LGPLLIRSGTGAVDAPVKEIRDEPGEVRFLGQKFS